VPPTDFSQLKTGIVLKMKSPVQVSIRQVHSYINLPATSSFPDSRKYRGEIHKENHTVAREEAAFL
jgi:hypothetical protein